MTKIYYGLTDKESLRRCIRAACETLNPNNVPQSIAFMCRIACQESHFGSFRDTYEAQGRGPWQFDEIRFNDIREYAVFARPEINTKCKEQFNIDINSFGYGNALDVSPMLCALLTRAALLKLPDAMPAVDDEDGQWKLYKKHWNSHLGAATRVEFVRNKIHMVF